MPIDKEINVGIIIFIVILAALAGYIIFIYNTLIRRKNLVAEGWSGIDVQLKQRSNLIPNLIEAVKGYMSHERNVLENITELRSQCLSAKNMKTREQNENMLTSALRQLFALSENYPNLKASENFIDLQNTLTKIEDQIQMSRRYYNGTVRDLNITIQSFPSNIIAKAFKFQPADFFEIDTAQDKEVPKVDFEQS